jgi:adenosylcobinamide-phosphate synthase
LIPGISVGLEVFLLAVAMDLVLGEPPSCIHPVVWIGRLIALLRRRMPASKLSGLLLAIIVILIAAGAGHVLVWAAGAAPVGLASLLAIVVAAYLLKSTFAARCLLETSMEIGKAIEDDLDKARRMLPALVGRDTESLSRGQAGSAVIESLSENYVDSLLSPLFFYLLLQPAGLGLEAALAFKAISTMDSMLGYKTAELKELGFFPARLDDMANFLPARLSIFLMALAMPSRARTIMYVALKDHARTPSPNSGWPMSGIAGALGLRLEKPGYYILNDKGMEPQPSDVKKAVGFMEKAIALTLIASGLLLQVSAFFLSSVFLLQA